MPRMTRVITVREMWNREFRDMPTTFDGWAEFLNSARAEIPEEFMNAATVTLRFEQGYDSDSTTFEIKYERPETDSEMADREGAEKEHYRAQEAKQRRLYESLKGVYETK